MIEGSSNLNAIDTCMDTLKKGPDKGHYEALVTQITLSTEYDTVKQPDPDKIIRDALNNILATNPDLVGCNAQDIAEAVGMKLTKMGFKGDPRGFTGRVRPYRQPPPTEPFKFLPADDLKPKGRG